MMKGSLCRELDHKNLILPKDKFLVIKLSTKENVFLMATALVMVVDEARYIVHS